MKLISMVDYVLNLEFDIKSNENEPIHKTYFKNVSKYARFLKQPLKLEMFVPCDEEGNVLEPPLKSDYGLAEPEFNTYKHPIECYGNDVEQYQKAKEKILFKGFELFDDEIAADYHLLFKGRFVCYTSALDDMDIEDLTFKILEPELTENAIKQL